MVLLKTKVKHLGFSRRELRKVGNQILASLPEDIEDDNLEEAIGKKIDEYMPILQMMQSAADRQRAAASRSTKGDDDDDPDDDDDDEDDDPDDDDDDPDEKKPKKKKKSKTVDDDDVDDDDFKDAPAWAKKLYKMVQGKGGSGSANSRRAKVEEAVRNAGHLGRHFLKEFDKKEFKSNDDFNNWLDDVREDCDEYERELTEKGLDKLNTPPAVRTDGSGGRFLSGGKEDVLSDDEVISLAKGE